MKIAIIGSPGSGKSTLNLQLHNISGIPLYHIDQYLITGNQIGKILIAMSLKRYTTSFAIAWILLLLPYIAIYFGDGSFA